MSIGKLRIRSLSLMVAALVVAIAVPAFTYSSFLGKARVTVRETPPAVVVPVSAPVSEATALVALGALLLGVATAVRKAG